MIVYYPSFSARSSLTHSLATNQSIDISLSLTIQSDGQLLAVTTNSTSPGTALHAYVTDDKVVVNSTYTAGGSLVLEQSLLPEFVDNHSLMIRYVYIVSVS